HELVKGYSLAQTSVQWPKAFDIVDGQIEPVDIFSQNTISDYEPIVRPGYHAPLTSKSYCSGSLINVEETHDQITTVDYLIVVKRRRNLPFTCAYVAKDYSRFSKRQQVKI